MTTTTTNPLTETVTSEFIVVQDKRSGQYATDAWYNHDRGQWTVEFDHLYTDAMQFPNAAAAASWARSWGAGAECRLVRVPAQVRLTAAGKADVAARRAARNADRKW
jgi:hypothetical protein